MTDQEFRTQMERMAQTYGPKAYPAERLRAIWQVVRNLEVRDFAAIVTDLIGTEKYAPMVPDFEAKARPFLASYRAQEGSDCALCDGSTWIVPDDAPMDRPPTVMRCPCTGTPQGLAQVIRTAKVAPDPRLAANIERTFAGVNPEEFKHYGQGILDAKNVTKRSPNAMKGFGGSA